MKAGIAEDRTKDDLQGFSGGFQGFSKELEKKSSIKTIFMLQ